MDYGTGDDWVRGRQLGDMRELRNHYGTNLPTSIRWGRNQPASSISPRRRRFSRSVSPVYRPPPLQQKAISGKPCFPRVHSHDVLVDTLTNYYMPWEYDKEDAEYIIILQELNDWETQVLFDHTRALKAGTVDEFEAGNFIMPGPGPQFRRRYSGTLVISESEDSDDEQPMEKTDDEHHVEKTNDEQPVEKSNSKSEFLTFDADVKSTNESPLQSVFHNSYGDDKKKRSHSFERRVRLGDMYTSPLTGQPPKDALFHVLHIQPDVLNFEKFLEAVLAIPQLRNVKHMVEEHLLHGWGPIVSPPWRGKTRRCKHTSAVHSAETQSTQDGKARFIPGRNWYAACDSEVHYTRDGNFHVISMSVPFAHLGDVDTVTRSQVPSETDVPTHTLFQSLNLKSDISRDSKQVVCRVEGGNSQRCQLISHMWAMIINDELLITYSPLSQEELYWSILNPSPAVAPSAAISVNVADIHVRTPDNSLWLLNRTECRTYFDFVAQFSSISGNFAKEYTIQYNGNDVAASQWAKLIEENTDLIMHITLTQSKEGTAAKTQPAIGPRTLIEGRNFQRSTPAEPGSEPLMPELTPTELLQHSKDVLHCASAKQSPAGQQSKPDQIDPSDRVMSFDTIQSESIADNKPTSVLTADQIYAECDELDLRSFNEQLESSCNNNRRVLEMTTTDEKTPLSKQDLDRLSFIIAFPYPFAPTSDGTLFADTVGGLQSILKLFPEAIVDTEMCISHTKILGAAMKFVTILHSSFVPQPTSAAILFLQNCCERRGDLKTLFKYATELDVYPFRFEAGSGQTLASSKGCAQFTKHVVAALLIAASLAEQLLELRFTEFEKELDQQPLTKVPSIAREIEASVQHMRVSTLNLENSDETSKTAQQTLEQELKQACAKLTKLSLSEDVLLRVLRLQYGWRRVAWHASKALRQLEQAFDRAMLAHPARKLSTRAAVLPPDLLAGLLQKVLHLPVMDGQDALFMYNRYVTELESELLTADSTTESLDRLRTLKHELNAFLQVRQKQTNVLQGLRSCLNMRENNLSLGQEAVFTYNPYPHPRTDLIDDSINKLDLQINNIHALQDLIEKLRAWT